MGSLEQKILTLLQSSDKNNPLKTLKIAKAVVGPKSRCKDVNPTLYALQKKNLINKISEKNGSNPRWYINSPNTDFTGTNPFIFK